jgi:hypothetical protein
MKLFARAGPFRALLAAAALIGTTDAFAHTTRSRPVEATIESINHETRTLTITHAKGKGPSVVALTKQTKFIHNWKFAPSSELRSGAHATVYYRTPFFGKPFATRVVWVNGV